MKRLISVSPRPSPHPLRHHRRRGRIVDSGGAVTVTGSGQRLQFRCLTGAPEDLLHRLSQRAAPDGRPVARPRRHATDRRQSGLVGEASLTSCAAGRCRRSAGRGPTRRRVDAFVAGLERALDEAAARATESGTAGHPSADQNRVRERRPRPAGARHRRAQPAAGRRYRPARVRQQLRSPVALARRCSSATCRRRGRSRRMAVGRPPSAPAIETYTMPGRLFQDDRADDRLPFGSRGGAVIDHHFPADGDYTVTIRLQKTLYNAVRGLADPHQLELRVNRAARAHVHRRRRRGQAAAGQLRRHADLESRVGAVREPCRRSSSR